PPRSTLFPYTTLFRSLGDPETRRVLGDLEVKNSSAVMGNHKEAVQHAEGQSGDREEIHGRDHFPVIAQESLPSLTWISPPRGTRSEEHTSELQSLAYL